MRKVAFWSLGMFAGLLVSSAAADTIESVEKEILEKLAKYTSCQGKSHVVQDMQTPDMKFKTEGQSTFECSKKGDKWLYRSEGKSKSVTVIQGQEQKSDAYTLSICDGEHIYTYSEADGQKTAMKMAMTTPFSMLPDKSYFDNMRKDYDLKLVGDESVDGRNTWVIEAASKSAASAQPGSITTMALYFDKETGMTLKVVGKDTAGKVVMTSTTSDFKVNPQIADDRFVFKAPEGVEVMDMTQMGGDATYAGNEEPATADEPEEPQAQAQPKQEEKKKEEAEKGKIRLPKLPGKKK